MRAALVVLVLVLGGWSNLAVYGCPMSPSAPDATTEHHHAGERHAGERDVSSSHHPESDCHLLMACASPVLGARSVLAIGGSTAPAAPASPAPRSIRDSAFPSHEPPPPRRPV